MNETTNLPVVATTPDIIRQKLNMALTKVSLSVQNLQNEADSLVFNEDNIEKIQEFLKKIKKAEKAVSDEHKALKEPYLEGSRACDSAKNDMLAITFGVSNVVQQKYASLCNEIDKRNREEDQRKAREKAILDGIAANLMDFSQKIAACQTREELSGIERLINLEKSPSRVSKYGNFHQQAIDKYNEVLIPILKVQKIKLDEAEALEKKVAQSDNPVEHEELTNQLAGKYNEILQNSVDVQQSVLNKPMVVIPEADVVTTEVKARRTEVVAEIVDMEEVFKKQRELLTIELKTKEAKKIGAELRDSGDLTEDLPIIQYGIKYSIRKLW